MKISTHSDLSMKYGWNDDLIDRLIRIYGEDYLNERESVYDSLEEDLEDYHIVKAVGLTLYHITPNITIIRFHAESLNSLLDSVLSIFKDQKKKYYGLKVSDKSKLHSIWDALEIEAMIRVNREWHRHMFSIIKNLPTVAKSGLPKEAVGTTLITGRSRHSSTNVLWDIYRNAFWKREAPNINNLKEGIAFLKNL